MTQIINAVVIEDSELARAELRHLLSDFNQINVIGEADSVESAAALILESSPDLIFLDVDLIGGTAFDLLTLLNEQQNGQAQVQDSEKSSAQSSEQANVQTNVQSNVVTIPPIIFTTAYDQYALKSFDFNTADYLLKPIKQSRLAQAIGKLNLSSIENNSTESEASNVLLSDSQFFIKDGEQHFLVKVNEVRYIEGVGNYSQVYFSDKSPLHYSSLSKIEKRLPQSQFFRINRQQIVNLGYVDTIEPWITGGLKLVLTCGTELEVSRRQTAKFKQLMSL